MSKSYSDKLPRKIHGKRCMALNDEGKTCTKKAVAEVFFHLDSEIYDHNPAWVRCYVCAGHMWFADKKDLGL